MLPTRRSQWDSWPGPLLWRLGPSAFPAQHFGLYAPLRSWPSREEGVMERSYGDWLPEDHPAYVLSEIVDHLDLSPVSQVYDNGGPVNLPYDSRMLVKLLLYAYPLGIFSSREIARQCVENVAFRLLMASNIPNFQVISEYRQRHLSALRAVFLQVLRCSRDIGLEKLGSLPLKAP